MTTLFISHSSKDKDWALSLRQALRDQGYQYLFLDSHPDDGITAGTQWEQMLWQRLRQSRGIVVLCSTHWLTSPWCVAEAMLAREKGKPVFLLAAADVIDGRQVKAGDDQTPSPQIPDFLKDTQLISLVGVSEEEALRRLWRGLEEEGLKNDFALPQHPYPGLEPFQEADAAVFFGRDEEIARVMGTLTRRRRNNAKGFIVVLGASGCGKSSLVRAGVLPRLKRAAGDDGALRKWVIPAPFDGGSGLGGLALALALAFREVGRPVELHPIRERLQAGRAGDTGVADGARALGELARELLLAHGVADGAVLLVLDQLEQVFATAQGSDARATLQLLLEASAMDASPVVVLATIRSDFLNVFQLSPGAAQRYEEITLDPTHKARFAELIEGPAERFGLRLDAGLVGQLVEDTSHDDALPLLAFTLERLYDKCCAQGVLTVSAYQDLFPPVTITTEQGARQEYRGVSAAIKHVADHILSDTGYATLAADDPRLRDLRRAFVSFARISDEGQLIRRTTRWANLPPSCTGVLERFVKQRLLISSGEGGTGELTVAHEALFRVWDRLVGWLAKERDFLIGKARVEQAHADWSALSAADRDKGLLAGVLLERARRWLSERPDAFDDSEREFLIASVARDDARRQEAAEQLARESRLQRRLARGAIAAAVIFALIGGLAGVLGWQARQERQLAEQRSALLVTDVARAEAAEGAVDKALLLLLDAAGHFTETNFPDELFIAFHRTLERASKQQVYDIPPNVNSFSLDDAAYLVDPKTRDILRFDGSKAPEVIWPSDKPIRTLALDPSGAGLIVVTEDLGVQRVNWRLRTKQDLAQLQPAPTGAGEGFGEQKMTVTKDGLVILQQASLKTEGGESKAAVYYYLLDVATGRHQSAIVPDEYELFYAPLPGQGRHLFGSSGHGLVRIDSETPAGTRPKGADAKAPKSDPWVYSCFGAPDKRIAAYAGGIGKLFGADPSFLTDRACSIVGNLALVSWLEPMSGGGRRRDVLVTSEGKQLDAKDLVNESIRTAGKSVPAELNATFVAVEPGSGLLAMMFNRDLYVTRIGDDFHGTDELSSEVTPYLRLPYPGDVGRFTGQDKLFAVDGVRGKIVQVDLRMDTHSPYDVKPVAAASDAAGRPVDPAPVADPGPAMANYNPGTCVGTPGSAVRRLGVLPSGEAVSLSTPALAESAPAAAAGDPEIVITGAAGGYRLQIAAAGFECVQFSRDWRRLLVLADRAVKVYDFEAARAGRALAPAVIGELANRDITSALFVGPQNDVITSDWGGRVTRWAPKPGTEEWVGTEVYRGNQPVIYAEPDRNGHRLLLIEDAGSGMRRGSLYSLNARNEMLDLGSEYKWLGLAFTDKLEIAVYHQDELSALIRLPTFATLINKAQAALSPACRPSDPGDLRTSACWPAEVAR